MKKLAFFAALALVMASCGSKQTETTETVESNDAIVLTAEQAYAPNGTVHVLDSDSLYVPGVQVPNLTVLDFNAVWCGPCRQLAPVLEELAGQYNGRVTFVSIDVDQHSSLFEQFNVGQAIPAVLIIKADGTTETYIGTDELLPAEKFAAILDRNL